MNKGISLRLLVHNILYDVYKFKKSLDYSFKKYKVDKLDERDLNFINNICLNTVRYSLHTKKILKLYVNNNLRLNEQILFGSAITQLIFLDFKNYAVINSSVEIAKKLKIYHGFVNATLKRIFLNKNKLKKNRHLL